MMRPCSLGLNRRPYREKLTPPPVTGFRRSAALHMVMPCTVPNCLRKFIRDCLLAKVTTRLGLQREVSELAFSKAMRMNVIRIHASETSNPQTRQAKSLAKASGLTEDDGSESCGLRATSQESHFGSRSLPGLPIGRRLQDRHLMRDVSRDKDTI